MLKRPIIEGRYVNEIIEVRYLGTDDEIMAKDKITKEQDKCLNLKDQDNLDTKNHIIANNGHVFQVLSNEDPKVEVIEDRTFEVIGWINKTSEFPYDFLLRDLQTEKYFAATLHGRSDGWPLFAIQNEKPTCSRTGMGSDWNCRMCVKYFGTTCKAW